MADNKQRQRRSRSWPSISGDDSQRASKALVRLEDITRLISEWVWETDRDGKLAFVSPRIFELTGMVPQMLLGKRFAELGGFEALNAQTDAFAPSADSASEPDWQNPFRDVFFHMPNTKGEMRTYLVSGIPFHDRETWEFEGTCGTAKDVTEILATETEVQTQKERAETASRTKTEFLANVSHELRTPLNAVIGYSDALKRQVFGDWSNPKYKEYIGNINEAGSHLLDLINDIIDVSAIESGNIDIQSTPVELSAVFNSVRDLTINRARDKEIALTFTVTDGADVLYGDERRIKQILINLVANAVKFTPTSGSVTVESIHMLDDRLCLRVHDTGIGMTTDEIAVAMEPFGQVRSGTDYFKEGTGLGLPLTKGLIESHRGELVLSSTPGKGTTVEAFFPVPVAPAP